jgi:hypothetical protein
MITTNMRLIKILNDPKQTTIKEAYSVLLTNFGLDQNSIWAMVALANNTKTITI